MPYEDPDSQDPMLLVGVSLPGDEASQREMVYGFAEEFARMGFDESRILGLFRQPFYAGAYAAYTELGEARIVSMIRETLEVWGHVRLVDRDVEANPFEFDGDGAVPGPEQRPCGSERGTRGFERVANGTEGSGSGGHADPCRREGTRDRHAGTEEVSHE